jgi:predicted transcriptional regulator
MTRAISELMQRDICVVQMEQTIEQVQTCFASRRLSWAPVIEQSGQVVGVISQHDLVRFQAQGLDAKTAQVWQLCSYKPISVDADTPLEEVARQMVARHIHHVIVMEQGTMIGVVSSLDFVRTFFT